MANLDLIVDINTGEIMKIGCYIWLFNYYLFVFFADPTTTPSE
jgi:hypothetical protein